MRIEMHRPWRKAPGKFIREHKPVYGGRQALRERSSKPSESRLIDRVTGMKMMLARDAETFSNISKRILVDKGTRRGLDLVKSYETDRTGIEHSPLDQTAPG